MVWKHMIEVERERVQKRRLCEGKITIILRCIAGFFARLKLCRKKSQVFTLVGLHTRRLNTRAECFH